MKKKILSRCLLGAPIGLTVSVVITILVSLITQRGGRYFPVVPELVADCGSELGAVVLQTVLSFVYGAAIGGASVVWETEWSLLKQTVLHLVIVSLSMLPIAYFCRWMPHSLAGILVYIGIFIAVYAVIWLSQYRSMKKRVQQMNERVAGM